MRGEARRRLLRPPRCRARSPSSSFEDSATSVPVTSRPPPSGATRAAWRIRTPESLIRATPPSSSVCRRTTSTASTAVLGLLRDPRSPGSTIAITITAATAITTTPSAIPNCHRPLPTRSPQTRHSRSKAPNPWATIVGRKKSCQDSRLRAVGPTTQRPLRIRATPLRSRAWRRAMRSGPSRRRRPRTGRGYGSGSFDWLCEQGHVGLERVAKARREPALVGAGEGGARGARGDLRASRGRRLGPARVAREPVAPGRARARAEGSRDRDRRVASFHVVPPRRARALSADLAVGFDLDEHKELCRAWCSQTDGLGAAWPRRRSASAETSASGPTTTRCATSRPGDGPSAARADRGSGQRRGGGVLPPPRVSPGASDLLRMRVVPVDDRDVDRRAASAADADLLRHLRRLHRRGQDIAACDADVVVRAVAVEDGPVGVLLDRRAAVEGTSPSRTCRIVIVAIGRVRAPSFRRSP